MCLHLSSGLSFKFGQIPFDVPYVFGDQVFEGCMCEDMLAVFTGRELLDKGEAEHLVFPKHLKGLD